MYCANCQYDLHKTQTGRCPECGQPFHHEDPSTWRRRPKRRWKKTAAILTLSAVVIIIASARKPIMRGIEQWVWDYTDPWQELTVSDFKQSQSRGRYTVVITHANWMILSDRSRATATSDEDLHWWLWKHRSSVDAYLVDVTHTDSPPTQALIDLGLHTGLFVAVYAPDGSVVWEETFLLQTQMIQALEDALASDAAATP